jgi:hypothetical protein
MQIISKHGRATSPGITFIWYAPSFAWIITIELCFENCGLKVDSELVEPQVRIKFNAK